jgi:hypothetical protein
VTLRARWVTAESSLGDAEGSLGDAESSLGESQMHAVAHAGATSVATIEQAFGHPLTTLFERFEIEPIASGSVAQVTPHPPSFRLLGSWFDQEVALNWLFPHPLITTTRPQPAHNQWSGWYPLHRQQE